MSDQAFSEFTYWTSYIFTILQLLFIFVALWVAARIALRSPLRGLGADEVEDEAISEADEFIEEAETEAADIMEIEADSDEEDEEYEDDEVTYEDERMSPRTANLLIWLALSGVFVVTFTDLLQLLQGLIGFVAVISAYGVQSLQGDPITSMWGDLPTGWYSLLSMVQLIFVYGLTLWAGRKLIRSTNPVFGFDLGRGSRRMLLLGAGSLIYTLVRYMVLRIVRFQLPVESPFAANGEIGFIAAWLLSLMIIVLAMQLMNSRLLKRELES
jgi:hypothetical protein